MDIHDIHDEVDSIIARAAVRQQCVTTLGPRVTFSTETGDAWLLDHQEGLALCLARDGDPLPVGSQDPNGRFAITWNARYRIDGERFVVTETDSGRVRSIIGYPTAEIVSACKGETILDGLQSDSIPASERLVAAELAGEHVVLCEELIDALVAICQNRNETDELRGRTAISLGPMLEYEGTMEYQDEDDLALSAPWSHRVQESLRKIYADVETADYVRRRVLEASVRAPDEWHGDAVRAAYASEGCWRVTAVFCMRFLRGFEREILESLESLHSEIHYQAVVAAGNWEIKAAWPHLVSLLTRSDTDKRLLLAAIDAVTRIGPADADAVLVDLTDHKEEDIVEAAHKAMAMAEVLAGLHKSDDGEHSDGDIPH